MTRSDPLLTTALLSILDLAARGDTARLEENESFGPNPPLPEPKSRLLPTVHVATAKGWTGSEMPVPADGLVVTRFAGDLDHPRWIHVLPNGDVLIAESNAPPRPQSRKGIQRWAMGRVMAHAGAGTPSADRITLFRDPDGDGAAEVRHPFLQGLHSPYGMALIGDQLYIANTDAVLRFPYRDGVTSIAEVGVKIADLPAGDLNHHWTKNLIASRDGSRLYATVGSNSNIGENGMENEIRRAAILEIDLATGRSRVFAYGLRNPNGMDWEPHTGMLWTVVNERDGIGSDLVPDYMTSVQDGGFYGWPYSYYGGHVDERVKPARPDLVDKAIKPDYAVGNHTASLGLCFSKGDALPERFRSGVFIGQHGSWNRKPRSGYKVVFVPFDNGKPCGPPEDVLTGFIRGDDARGRPVGVAMDGRGALLVADDVGNVVWRVASAGAPH